jgi:uncharacterized protein YqeY
MESELRELRQFADQYKEVAMYASQLKQRNDNANTVAQLARAKLARGNF